ncbi:MAG TPA: M20/M25/M40 family metallo-hydrolase [Brumimicrobium sp.]|nr:M20/M25/M40 family metallo-hydrolase [Brumimicrobium sp.]
MWIKISFLFLALCFTFSTYGQEAKAREIVERLCSEEFYGRGYVENGVNKAADFLKEEFQKAGLNPFFGDTTYFQDYSFSVNTFPGAMRIVSDDNFFRPGIDFIVNENSGSFKGELFLVELTPEIIADESKFTAALSQIESGKKNGILVDLTAFSDVGDLTSQLNFFSSHMPIVYLTDKKFTWSVARSQTKFPIIYFQKDVFIDNLLSVNIEAKLIQDFPNKNIAGYFPAKKKNAKTIVFTAHYDHLGGMGTTPNKTYFPGGNDNASGTAMLLSMADYFKDKPQKYNVLFIAFSGEEIGLLGSQYFVNSQVLPVNDVKFLINLDIMGSGEEGITVVNGSVFTKEFKKLQKINQKQQYLSQIKSRGEAANSDHWFFYKSGVPSIFIYTMGPNKHYHDVYDTYEELSFKAYDNIVKLLVDFVGKL